MTALAQAKHNRFLFFDLMCGTISGTNHTEKGAALVAADTVHSGAVFVQTRLHALDLTEEVLRTALAYGLQAASDGTAHDPASVFGVLVWGKTVRSLRDQLIPEGWFARNDHNYPTVVHPNGKTAITVAAGDDFTGLKDKYPTTRHEKGSATKRAIQGNQFSFADITSDTDWQDPESQKQTWLLLHFVDRDTQELRAELSLPAAMDDGRVTEWRERIILSSVPLDLDDVPSYDADEDAINIPVERKQAN